MLEGRPGSEGAAGGERGDSGVAATLPDQRNRALLSEKRADNSQNPSYSTAPLFSSRVQPLPRFIIFRQVKGGLHRPADGGVCRDPLGR